MNVMWL